MSRRRWSTSANGSRAFCARARRAAPKRSGARSRCSEARWRRRRERRTASETDLLAARRGDARSIRTKPPEGAPMAVAHETFQHLTTAGLAEVDPQIAELLTQELERQRGQIELIASENFTWPSVLEAVGSVPTNKYAEGYPGQALLRRLRDRRPDRADGDRSREGAVRRGARERPAARGRADEHGRLHGGATARRHDPVARARARRPSHARAQGQLLRTALHDRALRRFARDERRGLRRRAAAREGGAPEADRLRRQRLSAHGRHHRVPEDRRRGRRIAALRHGALRRARRGRRASESCRRLRLRHVDDAQDAGRPALRLHPLQGGARDRRSTAPSSRGCRAVRSSTRSRRRRRASRSR